MAVIRKHRGHFLEDFVPGDVYRHKGGKTVTEGLFTIFTDFSMTTNPLSKNARYAQAYGFDGLVVPPGLVMLVVFSQSVEDVSENARANLEYIDMRFGAPVYIGDTLEAETRVLGVKGSSSNPMLGVVHVQTTGRNQRGEVVLTFQRKVQVWKRDKDATLHDGEAKPERDRRVARAAGVRPGAALRRAGPPHQPRFLPRGLHAGRRHRALARPGRHHRSHHADRHPRQHLPGALQSVDGVAGSRALRGRPADRVRRHPLQPLSRHLVGRRRRQLARRHPLRHGASHRAHLRGRHGLRQHRDPRAWATFPAGPISACWRRRFAVTSS